MSEIVVFSTLSAREALIELVPEFEHASGHKVDISYSGGPGLADRIRNGTTGDLFVGPDEFSGPLITEGKLFGHTRMVFARSSIGICVRAGGLKPDISSPGKLKNALLAARAVSYSKGSSGIYFVKALETLGIGDAIAAKLVPPNPDELVGAVVARGGADIGAQQFSELLPVSGIEILGPARLNGDVDDELSLRGQRRVYRGNPHIVRQRVFELVEEVGPRERPLIDDAVGLAGRVGNHVQFFGVDLRPNRRGFASQPRRFALRIDGMGAERPLALGQ